MRMLLDQWWSCYYLEQFGAKGVCVGGQTGRFDNLRVGAVVTIELDH